MKTTDDRKGRGRRDVIGVFVTAILPLLLLIGLFVYVAWVLSPLS